MPQEVRMLATKLDVLSSVSMVEGTGRRGPTPDLYMQAVLHVCIHTQQYIGKNCSSDIGV